MWLSACHNKDVRSPYQRVQLIHDVDVSPLAPCLPCPLRIRPGYIAVSPLRACTSLGSRSLPSIMNCSRLKDLRPRSCRVYNVPVRHHVRQTTAGARLCTYGLDYLSSRSSSRAPCRLSQRSGSGMKSANVSRVQSRMFVRSQVKLQLKMSETKENDAPAARVGIAV